MSSSFRLDGQSAGWSDEWLMSAGDIWRAIWCYLIPRVHSLRRGLLTSASFSVLVAGISFIWFVFIFHSFSAADESEAIRKKYQAKLDQSVDRGLKYLAGLQVSAAWAKDLGNTDLEGSFYDKRVPGNTGITSLAVMAFLAKGHTPGNGPYGKAIDRGIDFVLRQQHPNGLLISKKRRGRTTGLMYAHSISTLMLCEVSGMVSETRQKKLDKVLSKALLVLLQAQKVPKSESNRGGWRYGPGTTQSDLSLTGWSIMALRAAKLNGVRVPDEHIEMAIGYILKCRGNNGSFQYTPYMQKPGLTATSMTGVAVLCMELCGEHGHESIADAGDYILDHPPVIKGKGHPYYCFYYCGQAMFQLGGKHWNEFAPYMYDTLLKDQAADGSWGRSLPNSPFDRTYPTALAILTLTVSARQLPIYQREE